MLRLREEMEFDKLMMIDYNNPQLYMILNHNLLTQCYFESMNYTSEEF